jgi:hypothetical protein
MPEDAPVTIAVLFSSRGRWSPFSFDHMTIRDYMVIWSFLSSCFLKSGPPEANALRPDPFSLF